MGPSRDFAAEERAEALAAKIGVSAIQLHMIGSTAVQLIERQFERAEAEKQRADREYNKGVDDTMQIIAKGYFEKGEALKAAANLKRKP